MLQADIRMDLRAFEAALTDTEQRQLPFALSLALTETVRSGRIAVQQEMDRVFDRPTPYAKRGVVYDRATRHQLVASVVLAGDRTRGGLPATAFLGPQVHGGLRSHKAFERQLIQRGFMKANEVAVPAARTRLNRYGNMSQGLLNRVLSGLGVDYRGAGATRLRSANSRKHGRTGQAGYFVPARGGHLFPGIYRRGARRDLHPVMLFVGQRPYEERLPFFEVVSRHAGDHFARNFEQAFARAMRTAR